MTTLNIHHLASGAIVLTPDPVRPLMPDMPAPLALAGGLVVVDAERPGAIPWIRVDDPDLAADWLSILVGSEALVALKSRATAVESHSSVENHVLIRLAFGLWLHRWWPSSDTGAARLDQHLLRAEIGALIWAAGDWLDDPDVEQWLGPEEWAVLEILTEQQTVTGSPARRTAWVVALRLIAEAAEDLAPDSALADLDLTLPTNSAEPAIMSSTRDDYALASGGVRSTGIDWWLVPPRSVGGLEDAVRWNEQGGILTVEATVGDEPADDLRFRAYATGEVLPSVTGPMTRTGSTYHGQDATTALDPIELVEIYHPAQARPPAGAVGSTWREGIRRVARARTRAAATGDAVDGIWPYAAEILATTPAVL